MRYDVQIRYLLLFLSTLSYLNNNVKLTEFDSMSKNPKS